MLKSVCKMAESSRSKIRTASTLQSAGSSQQLIGRHPCCSKLSLHSQSEFAGLRKQRKPTWGQSPRRTFEWLGQDVMHTALQVPFWRCPQAILKHCLFAPSHVFDCSTIGSVQTAYMLLSLVL